MGKIDISFVPNDLYVVVHEHGNGADAYLFRFEGVIPAEPEQWVADELGIDFEPERGESLLISQVIERGHVPLLRKR